MANTDLLLSSPTAGDRQKGTISVWVKRTAIQNNGYLYSTWNTSAGGYSSGLLQFTGSTDQLVFTNYQANGGTHTELKTNRKFRDLNCWYHICVNWDTTLATSSDRYKMFINGVRETSFATATYPSQNENLFFDIGGANNPIRIGSVQGTSAYLDAVLSHYHKIDGTAYDASTFGSFDSTSGEWKINTSPTLTYGSGSGNFFVLKDSANLSGSTVQDQSGEGNDLTVDGGTLTNTEDCPSNVFATINALDNYYAGSSFANGNTYLNTSSSNYTFNNSTLGYNKGKFYWEIKVTQNSGYDHLGITSKGSTGSTNYMYNSDYSYTLKQSGVLKENTGSGQQTVSGFSGTSYSTDIISIAHDADNNKIYFAKDGVWMNSANPSTPTGGITTTAASATDTGFWLPAFGDEYASGASIYLVNFGNGYFGTTAISSEGTNASGIGKFEYDVPTGYTALSTKGLNE